MKYPKKIYLQFDPEGESATDYYEGVTWCQDKINSNDIEYIRADLLSASQQAVQPDTANGWHCRECSQKNFYINNKCMRCKAVRVN